MSAWAAGLAAALVLSSPSALRAAGPKPDPDPARVVATPVALSGTEDEGLRVLLDERIAQALSGGSLEFVAHDADPTAAPCSDPGCWRTVLGEALADYAVHAEVTFEDPDYRLRVELISQQGEVEATAADGCDLCGREEVGGKLHDLVASLRRKVEAAVSVAPPVLIIQSVPPGAMVFVDKERVGVTPLETTVEPGKHRIRLESGTHFPEKRVVSVVDGVREQLTFELRPIPEQVQRPRPTRALRGAGIAGIVLGTAGVGTGIALLVLHARPIRSQCSGVDEDPDGRCRYLHDTQAGGIASLVVGAAVLATGAALLAIARKRDRGGKRARLRPTASGLALAF